VRGKSVLRFIDKNGKVMTYVTFEGGEIELAAAVFEEWAS